MTRLSAALPNDPVYAEGGPVSETVSNRIERAIRRDIVNGVFAPGDRLRASDLGSRYGVSHIPVREALRQLEGDRLVVIESHKGAVLRKVDRKFVTDIHDTRQAIERMLVRRATMNATAADLAALDRLATEYEAAASTREQKRMVQANRSFHQAIAQFADNPEAAGFLDRGWELVIGLSNRYGRGAGRVQTIIDQHRRLVHAIASRDEATAMAVIEEHCETARDDLLQQMTLLKDTSFRRGMPAAT
jgi:DNA-binding GntR family transcriptional regulator